MPGNFHISTHAFSTVVDQLIMKGHKIDFSHKVNSLNFGNETYQQYMKRFVGDRRNISPLDGFVMRQGPQPGQMRMLTNYYLNIIETVSKTGSGKQKAFEFTHSEHSVTYPGYPAVYFRYEMSPVGVHYDFKEENFGEFLIRCCAIIGGVFAVAGIIEGLVFETNKAVFGKKKD